MDLSASSSASSAPLHVNVPSTITQTQMLEFNLSPNQRSLNIYLYPHELFHGVTYYLPLLEFLHMLTVMVPASKDIIEVKKRHLYDHSRRPPMQDQLFFVTYQRNVVVKVKRKITLVNCEFVYCCDVLSILNSWCIPDSSDYLHITNCLQHFLMGYIQAKALAWLVLISNLFL